MSQSSYVEVLLRSSPAKPARSPVKTLINDVKAKRFKRTVGSTAANSANTGGISSARYIGAVYLAALLAFFAGNADLTSLGSPSEFCRSEVVACQVCTRSHLVW